MGKQQQTASNCSELRKRKEKQRREKKMEVEMDVENGKANAKATKDNRRQRGQTHVHTICTHPVESVCMFVHSLKNKIVPQPE